MEYTNYRQLEKDVEELLQQEHYIEAVNLLGNTSEFLPQDEYEKNYFVES